MVAFPSITFRNLRYFYPEYQDETLVLYLAIFQICINCHKKPQQQNISLQDLKVFKITWKILLLQKLAV